MTLGELLVELAKKGKRSVAAGVTLLSNAISGSDRLGSNRVLNVHIDGTLFDKAAAFTITLGLGASSRSGSLTLDELRTVAHSENELAVLAVHRAFFGLTDFPPPSCLSRIRRALPGCDELSRLIEGAVATDRTSDVVRRLSDRSNVRLVGPSASGKTVTATQVASHLALNNWTISWLDLSDPGRDAFDLLLSLCRCTVSGTKRHLVVVDDAQANLGETLRLAEAISVVKKVTKCELSFLVVTWESSASMIVDAFPDAVTISCYGDHVIPAIARDFLGAEQALTHLNAVLQTSAGDLLLAKLMLAEIARGVRVPSGKELAALAFDAATGGHHLSDDDLKTLYRIAATSQFEIDIARSYLESYGATSGERLVGYRIVRLNGDYLAVGHRSLARMILLHLKTTKPELINEMSDPGKIAVDYLRSATAQQIVSTLERLDVASLANSHTDQHGTTFLAKAWDSLLTLISYLAKQARTDCSWGDNQGQRAFCEG